MADFFGDIFDNEIIGEDSDDDIRGDAGNDTLSGGDGEDEIRGEDGDDTISGNADDDRLFGGPNDDKMNGGDGDDTVQGGEGNDTVQGGEGNDSLNGGPGGDRFNINKGDDFETIQDYDAAAGDTIQISGFTNINAPGDLAGGVDIGPVDTTIDLGLVENGVPGVQVVTVADEIGIGGITFDFSIAPFQAAPVMAQGPSGTIDTISGGTMGVFGVAPDAGWDMIT
jgi:Ca2+-binding RTX toxin-like protein